MITYSSCVKNVKEHSQKVYGVVREVLLDPSQMFMCRAKYLFHFGCVMNY